MSTEVAIAPADVSRILEWSGFTKDAFSASVIELGHKARTNLVNRVQKSLNTSARDYVKAIMPVEVEHVAGGVRVVLELRGAFANMVENGATAWDLRESMLKPSTRKIRTSKAGYMYLSVPFRHMGVGASGKNAQALGSAYTRDDVPNVSKAFHANLSAKESRTMGLAVRKEAEKLMATWSRSTIDGGTAVIRGGRLRAGAGGATIMRKRHVTDIYAGMIREEKMYEVEEQDKMTTFRTISNNPGSFRSDEAASPGFGGTGSGTQTRNWVHPGITARFLIPKTVDYLDSVMSVGIINV